MIEYNPSILMILKFEGPKAIIRFKERFSFTQIKGIMAVRYLRDSVSARY